MGNSSAFRRLFGQDIPVIQAPMAGGITTPELVAAVSNSGALGSLGAGYMTPDEIRSAVKKIRSLTQRPYNVNLFIPGNPTPPGDLAPMRTLLASLWDKLSDVPLEAASLQFPSFEDQVEVLLEEKVPIFSVTFGIPSSSLIRRFRTLGTLVLGTATTPEEAEQLENAGVDAIVCQGYEAGGHRGNFSSQDPFYGLLTLLALTRTKVRTPLIAAGGIMDGRSASATFLAGACAALCGTAFITTTESGASPGYKESLLQAPHPSTALSIAFSGKAGRAIINPLMQHIEGHSIPPWPIQHFLTHRLRSLAAEKNSPEWMALWAGQGYPLCRPSGAAALIERFVNEGLIL